MPHIPFQPRPRGHGKLPEPTRTAPLASQPLAGIPEVPDLDMPLVPVDRDKPPVRRHGASSEELRRAPGLGRLSMRTYGIDPEDVAKRLGLKEAT